MGLSEADFSGGILALHLLQHGVNTDDIFVIDDRPSIGLGQAYSATAPWHLLNIRASGMSPLLDQPDAFVNFLDKQTDLPPEPGAPLGERFVPRLFYGRFLVELIETAKNQGGGRPRLTHLRGRAVAVKRNAAIPNGYEILLGSGRSLPVSQVVLALGNLPPSKPKGIPVWFAETGRYIGDPWNPGAISAIARDDRVLLLGTGLTAIDSLLSLAAQDHLGPMIAVSRHGLLPRSHSAQVVNFGLPLPIHVPPRRSVNCWCRVRDQVKAAAAAGVSWQAVINSLRPATQDLWRGLPEAEKARFIRHIQPWWDVHRHRLAPGKWQEIQKLIAAGWLIVKAGRIEGYHQAGDAMEAEFSPRSQTGRVSFGFDGLINCMGPNYDFAASDQPLLRQMVESGFVRPNTHRLGLDVDMACAVVDREGRIADGLYAMGPMLRGQFWEINAVPEIAKQARDLAGLLAWKQHDALVRSR